MLLRVDHHIHTIFSGHDESEMSIENILHYSEELGLTSIAITPHIPPLYKTDDVMR